MIYILFGLLNASANTLTLLTFEHLKWVPLPNFSFCFLREKGTKENPQSLDLKSLQVPKALQVDWELLELQLAGLQSLQNAPVPSYRAYKLHGFLHSQVWIILISPRNSLPGLGQMWWSPHI